MRLPVQRSWKYFVDLHKPSSRHSTPLSHLNCEWVTNEEESSRVSHVWNANIYKNSVNHLLKLYSWFQLSILHWVYFHHFGFKKTESIDCSHRFPLMLGPLKWMPSIGSINKALIQHEQYIDFSPELLWLHNRNVKIERRSDRLPSPSNTSL